jgi:dTDP-4-amino-4,6-dideoxygalactose transaminase
MTVQEAIPILDLGPCHAALRTELQAAFDRVISSGQYILGSEVTAFEREAAAYLGSRHAVGVNSGTDALVIALRALGIGPGDEVITTAFTFFASGEAINAVGATPCFVDIDPDTLNIDPRSVAAAVTPRTRAILPVHLFGRAAALDALESIAAEHGLAILEDCAQSFGARDAAGRRTGTVGVAGAFSFFPSKNLGALGDGGLIATDDDRVAEESRALRAHGSLKKYHNERFGYNSRLDALQAAILRVKLPHVESWNVARAACAARYDALLGGIAGLTRPKLEAGCVFHQYTVRIARNRDGVAKQLSNEGISTMVYYPVPLHKLPVYADHDLSLPNSERAAAECLSLPIWPELDDATAARVAAAVGRAVEAS